MKFFLILALAISHIELARAEILMDGSFSRSDLSVYKALEVNGKTLSGKSVAEGFGDHVEFFDNIARFQVHRSDASTWSRMRTELATANYPLHTELWYGFGVLVPDKVTTHDSPVAVFQIHDTADVGENGSRHSPLYVSIDEGNSMKIYNSYDTDRITTPSGTRSIPNVDYIHRELASWDLAGDKWNNLVIHARWAGDNSGFIEIWRNGQLVFSENNHPNTFNDEVGSYAKLGIYTIGRSNDWNTISAYHTGLVIGDARENLSTMRAAIVPEPSIYAMLLSGIGILAVMFRRRV